MQAILKSRVFAVAAGVFFVAAAALAQAPAAPNAAPARLSAGIHQIHAEVADTEGSRRQGLMYRESLPPNHGMLFIFEQPDLQCFWMRNTPLPLSIAFISDDGTIVNLEDMAPRTDAAHCSKKPVRYALEMAQGWFKEHGITAGRKIDGLP